MPEFLLVLISTILVNNFVLVQFLGLCPFMGVSNKLETAMGMSLATTFVLTLSSVLSYLTYTYILSPLGVEYLRTISFILVIAVTVQFTEMVMRKTSPLLYRVLGIFLPLITTNCAVRGAADGEKGCGQFYLCVSVWLWRGAGFFPGAGAVRGHA